MRCPKWRMEDTLSAQPYTHFDWMSLFSKWFISRLIRQNQTSQIGHFCDVTVTPIQRSLEICKECSIGQIRTNSSIIYYGLFWKNRKPDVFIICKNFFLTVLFSDHEFQMTFHPVPFTILIIRYCVLCTNRIATNIKSDRNRISLSETRIELNFKRWNSQLSSQPGKQC